MAATGWRLSEVERTARFYRDTPRARAPGGACPWGGVVAMRVSVATSVAPTGAGHDKSRRVAPSGFYALSGFCVRGASLAPALSAGAA